MNKKKVVYVVPHLSTGGLPQYLLKKVELLKDTFDITVIEWENITGGVLVVQRNQLHELLGDKLITLGKNKHDIIGTISYIQPDIIHFEEIPEMHGWIPQNIAELIYNSNRDYLIFETSHDSSFDVTQKRFFPDKFLFVSQWQINQYESLGIPMELVEYPIEMKSKFNPDTFAPLKIEAKIKLGIDLDSSFKHVVSVGLFTPRKNQAEIIEIARKMQNYPIKFHIIGNMADNFKWYWEPLLKDLPSNVVIWGERKDVDNFYQAADLFLFCSKGHDTDKETMPLVIREAISWQIPSLIYNLPVYLNYFDKYDNISYLDFNDIDTNIKLILNKLNLSKQTIGKDIEQDVVIISAYPNNKASEDLTLKCIKNAKKWEKKVILTSHCSVSQEIQDQVDYLIVDKNNILVKHDFYSQSWYNTNEYYALVYIKKEGNDTYHGPAVYTNYYNGINLAHRLGFKTAYCHNFDMVLEPEAYERFKQLKGNKLGVFNLNKALEGQTLRTVFHVVDTDLFLESFPLIRDGEKYNMWQQRVNSESNGLENIYYHQLKDKINSLVLLDDNSYYKQFENSTIDVCSCVEYYTVLAVKNQPDKYAIWFSTQNKVDSRTIYIDSSLGKIDKVYVNGITQKYYIRDKKEETIYFDTEKGPIKKINITPEYDFEANGYIELK
jgi:glycosyltransferase involved in cell wall biosynthesis